LPLVALVSLAFVLGGCSASNPATGGSPDAAGAADVATATYGASACGACVSQGCMTEVTTCNSDPDCSRYLSCLDGCGVGSDGNVDPACAAACPRGSSTSAMTAEMQVDDCRTAGAGASCAACGIDGGAAGNPILHQSCTPMTDTSSCSTCEDNSCCQTYAKCHADPDCPALLTCLQDCLSGVADDAGAPAGGPPDGGSCDLLCATAHPTGLVDWAPRITCILQFCAVACEDPPMPPLPACEACTNQFCAEQYADLNGTPDGYLFGACFAACPSGANPCTDGCFAQYPSAKARADALDACVAQNCPSCM
jgi:hypothetical protein